MRAKTILFVILALCTVCGAMDFLPSIFSFDSEIMLAMPVLAARYAVTPEQTGMMMAYKNKEFIADLAMPIKKLLGSKTTFTFLERNLADGFTVPSTLVGRMSKVNKVDFKVEERSGKCNAYGLGDIITQEDIDEADGQISDLVSDSLQDTMNLVLQDREKRVANIVQNASNYLSGKVFPVATADKFNAENSNPLRYILEILEEGIVRPNRMIIGQKAWTALRTNPMVVKAVHGNAGDSGVASRQAVAELLELQEIIVGQSFMNTVKKGKEAALVPCWGDSVALHYCEPTADGKRGLAWGLTFQSGDRYATTEWSNDYGLKGGYDVKAGAYWAETVMAKGAGMLLTGVLS